MALMQSGGVDETESMPDTMVAPDVIKATLLLACRAPSLHNSQPWRWVADGAAVHLYVDPNRVMYSADRRGREAIISCGAVLDHFRVAMAAAGWRTHVVRFPDPNDRRHVASIEFTPADVVTDADVVVPTRLCCAGRTGFRWRRPRPGTRWNGCCGQWWTTMSRTWM